MAVFLIYFLPMVLPTLIYALWRLWRARSVASGIPAPDGTVATAEAIDWRRAPWLRLILAGAALLTVVLLTGVFTEGAKNEGRYVPPHLENGRIVPGGTQSESGGTQPGTASPP